MKPTGSWMKNEQYLAQVGHFFGALSVMLIYGVFTHEMHVLVAFAVGAVLAAAKEFIYDMAPWGEGDSFGDSMMDYSFYIFGGTVGVWIAHLAVHHLCI
jgi:hypothetical protein